MTAGLSWYQSSRINFLKASIEGIVGILSNAATSVGLHIESDQNEEWRSSIGLLQTHLKDKVELIKSALSSPNLDSYTDIILEYDFRRRGLRIDCLLLGKGIIAVVEFKRSKIAAADRDQVTNYCINLFEFHEETRRVCESESCIIVPVICLTAGKRSTSGDIPRDFHNSPWGSVVRRPLECDSTSFKTALLMSLGARTGIYEVNRDCWLESKFAPSSTILDAAISLYGAHDVAAIANHAASTELISECTEEVAEIITKSKNERKNRIIFVSGAPGAGKTLVGLKLAFDPRFRSDAVFVTGNAPLVDVLTKALQNSYQSSTRRRSSIVCSGYSKKDSPLVLKMATFKIVKAHNFLGERGRETGSKDGSVVIFDEAQRTYAKGKEVLRKPLEEDEAELIVRSLEKSFPEGGIVIIALIGHNQAINRGELGIVAWFRAAEKYGWNYAISNETLGLEEIDRSGSWGGSVLRELMRVGHLPHSLRYYRNGDIEKWIDAVLNDLPVESSNIASSLEESDKILVTRNLEKARQWARRLRVGEERAGIIASSQGRRLAAEGLFVELKPDIANWILAPSGDIRSSNMLETVQNQYQIQGLEIDYSIVCWDGDLRREGGVWKAYRMSGSEWQTDKEIEVSKNSYRVLLTRARKGMIIFVPNGDRSGEDLTRGCEIYDEIVDYLVTCGAKLID